MSLPHLVLWRCFSTADGVFGRMGPFTTVEEEWQENRPNVSCIPAGTYICERSMYHRGGYETFEIMDVPGRSLIKLHVLNTEEGTEGCPGIASRLGTLKVRDEDSGERIRKIAGLASRTAFTAWMESMEGVDRFILEIKWVEDGPNQG